MTVVELEKVHFIERKRYATAVYFQRQEMWHFSDSSFIYRLILCEVRNINEVEYPRGMLRKGEAPLKLSRDSLEWFPSQL